MSEQSLYFEWVSDIHSNYPYLCICDDIDRINPFMEIGITNNKELSFTFYASKRNVKLSAANWEQILVRANEFYPKALAVGP